MLENKLKNKKVKTLRLNGLACKISLVISSSRLWQHQLLQYVGWALSSVELWAEMVRLHMKEPYHLIPQLFGILKIVTASFRVIFVVDFNHV